MKKGSTQGWPARKWSGKTVRRRPVPSREFSVLIERDSEGWLVGSVPELRGCHTQARTLDQLMKRVKEAIQACLEAGEEELGGEFVGLQRIRVGG